MGRLPQTLGRNTVLTPTFIETLIFTLPLPIIIGVIAYIPIRRRRIAAIEAVERVQPFGGAPAAEIASQLTAGLKIGFSHKEYCGRGLIFWHGHYLHDHIHDGEFEQLNNLMNEHRMCSGEIFETKEKFIAWLSEKTDAELLVETPQAITSHRLRKALVFCSTPRVRIVVASIDQPRGRR